MSLAFRCKHCERLYRNVSIELSGRRVRCECGCTQRLMTKAAKKAYDKIRKRRIRNPKFEVLEHGDERTKHSPREVYDLQSQSVVTDPVEEVELKAVGLSGIEDHVPLTTERRLAAGSKKRVSTLPTLPPGSLRKSFRLSPVQDTHNRILDYLGVLCGGGAALLGTIICFLGVQMILAGTQKGSFVDPIFSLHPPLGNDLGVKLAGLLIMLTAIAMAVGGIAQLTGSLLAVTEKKQTPQWPDGLVAAGAAGFVIVALFGMAAVFQVADNKLAMRKMEMDDSIKITMARNHQNANANLQFIEDLKDEYERTQVAVRLASREMFWKTIPLLLLAFSVSIISVIRFRNYVEEFDFS